MGLLNFTMLPVDELQLVQKDGNDPDKKDLVAKAKADAEAKKVAKAKAEAKKLENEKRDKIKEEAKRAAQSGNVVKPHNPAAKNDVKKDDTAMTKEKMKQKAVDEINAKKAAAREKAMMEEKKDKAKQE